MKNMSRGQIVALLFAVVLVLGYQNCSKQASFQEAQSLGQNVSKAGDSVPTDGEVSQNETDETESPDETIIDEEDNEVVDQEETEAPVPAVENPDSDQAQLIANVESIEAVFVKVQKKQSPFTRETLVSNVGEVDLLKLKSGLELATGQLANAGFRVVSFRLILRADGHYLRLASGEKLNVDLHRKFKSSEKSSQSRQVFLRLRLNHASRIVLDSSSKYSLKNDRLRLSDFLRRRHKGQLYLRHQVKPLSLTKQ